MPPTPPQLPTQLLGSVVRERRRRLKLRQLALADLAGVGVAFLYDLERGKPTLRLDKVLAVLEVLGLGLVVEVADEVITARPDAGAGTPGDAP
ncbi:MAG: type II toxin-antitoxin system Y4mF family antitoxin [Planctomycetota bacterium]